MQRNERTWLVMSVALVFGTTGCSLALFADPPAGDAGDTADDAADADADADADAEVPPNCGNEVVDEDDGEECDDGNDIEGDGCDNDCTFSCSSDVHCRDTEICNGAETCDMHMCFDGIPLDNGTPCLLPDGGAGECRVGVCRPLTCGDENTDDGEECDDGNDNDNDGCPSTCFYAVCGDGFVWNEAGGDEECDDGNAVDDDGCDSDCTWSCSENGDCDDLEPCTGEETCVDHVCEAGTPLANGTPCTSSMGAGACRDGWCEPDLCGNGVLDPPEEECEGELTQSCTTFCGSTGSQTCVDCHWTACALLPETCNGEDDDCDTRADNGIWCAWTNVDGNVFLQDVWVDAVDPIGFAAGYDQVTNAVVIAQWMPGAVPEWVEVVREAEGTRSFLGVWGFGMEDAWAAGASALLYRWGSSGWVAETAPWATSSVTTMDAVWGTAPTSLWVVGRQGHAYRWDGSVWTLASAGSVVGTNNLVGLCGNSATEMWAVGEAATIVRWTGSRWEAESVAMGTPQHLWECWSVGSAVVWAVGENGAILSRNASTAAWVESPSPTSRNLNGVWGSPATPTWIVGDGGTILRHTTGGWVSETVLTSIDFTAIHGRGGTAPFAVAVNRSGDVFRWRP